MVDQKRNNTVEIENVTKDILAFSSQIERPIIIGIDGASGSGKSTVALEIGEKLGATVVPLDDFFSANIPDKLWDDFTIDEKLLKIFDWVRVRELALEPLLNGKVAKWHSFDFLAGIQEDGTYLFQKKETTLSPAKIIILEGSYSTSSYLSDLLDMTIMVEVPIIERHRRISLRENDVLFLEKWHARWDAVELYYFDELTKSRSFNFIITG